MDSSRRPITKGFWNTITTKEQTEEVKSWKNAVNQLRTLPPKHKSTDNHLLNLYTDGHLRTDCDDNYCGRMCKTEDLIVVSELGLIMCWDSWQRFLQIADETG